MTYTEDQLTPWFDGKPLSTGVWEVENKSGYRSIYSYFDGQHWNGGWPSIGEAFICRYWYSRAGHQGVLEGLRVKYRGLNFDPDQQA